MWAVLATVCSPHYQRIKTQSKLFVLCQLCHSLNHNYINSFANRRLAVEFEGVYQKLDRFGEWEGQHKYTSEFALFFTDDGQIACLVAKATTNRRRL